MSSPGGDWRNGLTYEYFDDLGPEQIAFEFLRRNPDYAAEFAQVSQQPPEEEPPPTLAHWGLRFRGRSTAPSRSGGCPLDRARKSQDGNPGCFTAGLVRWAGASFRESIHRRHVC